MKCKWISLVLFLLGLLPSCIADISPEMVFVEGGEYFQANTLEVGDQDESPGCNISVHSFYLGKYEVTQAEWKTVMGKNPAFFVDENRPIESISWHEAQEFISRLNEITGEKYRLPTEEEWQYAAQGGKYQVSYIYSGSNNLDSVAHANLRKPKGTLPVGSLKPNTLGLYDMTGNVHEWCENTYDSLLYAKYAGLVSWDEKSLSEERTVKGGSWASPPKYARIANRNYCNPKVKNFDIGFRLALDVDTKE